MLASRFQHPPRFSQSYIQYSEPCYWFEFLTIMDIEHEHSNRNYSIYIYETVLEFYVFWLLCSAMVGCRLHARGREDAPKFWFQFTARPHFSTPTYTPTHTHPHIHAHISIHTSIYIQIHPHLHIHIYISIHPHTYTHIHTYTRAHLTHTHPNNEHSKSVTRLRWQWGLWTPSWKSVRSFARKRFVFGLQNMFFRKFSPPGEGGGGKLKAKITRWFGVGFLEQFTSSCFRNVLCLTDVAIADRASFKGGLALCRTSFSCVSPSSRTSFSCISFSSRTSFSCISPSHVHGHLHLPSIASHCLASSTMQALLQLFLNISDSLHKIEKLLGPDRAPTYASESTVWSLLHFTISNVTGMGMIRLLW